MSKLIKYENEYSSNASAKFDLDFIQATNPSDLVKCFSALEKSKSQLRQDLFVLTELAFLQGGYFVEFGATNGVDFSNSYLLEKEFSWKGILAEPSKIWHKELHLNRPLAIISELCVWKDSNSILNFNETSPATLSTINEFSASDLHFATRKGGTHYDVRTISLMDLLKKYDALKDIDYLSLDTEGSEFEILNAFDFSEYSFRVITCEHNYTENREKIYALLIKHGYKRCFESISKFDDWYTKV